ncbi:DNA-binding transcriptional regulator KdgR [Vibrio fluvialis]|jgi:IclR family KDG regulon transcriptional repressor|uniref:Transcriptional regulator KdgR, KDG operon repressor n=1 Tax=Vibrio fluvialis PG41 TaxID=1336752 RepID=S7JIF9_VIBFL|nr:DNA-binding transcriptional regulator KdgR [Vibrio fluvialis]TNF21491.1 MAG: DNA-binding transcriptional regulator KdgR [Vibrionaceae bacterium]EKO3379700.1 DNA-binding transcriptional regulator KdgR [Vibrio fluvialis]EKO3386371.1 DNA-binding transcriptional regulator KdgR [Vibrio fluvialis]EKO3402504.1 DNA-binding transcriptional regulator KdgR [Vibrio fluvialis]EKO3424902.1 DNA-binding transcriptional regulator KdgR [Vibrio fluvialis]
MEKSTQPEAVSSVLKVFSILQALGEQKEIGVSELSQRLMMSKATTYRFLQTMKSMGFVAQEGEADKYKLTLKLFELGAKSLEYVDLIELADKEMRYISEQTNEALHLGSLDENAIIYIHKIDSGYNLRMQSRIGRRNPLYSTAIGKVLLAERDEQFVRDTLEGVEFIKHTDRTLENVEQLLEELARVRTQHYAEDNEEQEPGLRCIAAPVYDRFGHVIAGLSMSLPTIRFDEQRMGYYVDLLQTAGRNISLQLGYNNYPA